MKILSLKLRCSLSLRDDCEPGPRTISKKDSNKWLNPSHWPLVPLMHLTHWVHIKSCATEIQSTIVISTSVISNNRWPWRKNLVLVITQKSKIRLWKIVEKRRKCSWGAISPLFHTIFNLYFYLKESNCIVICQIWLFKLFFPQYYKSDMSKYGYLELIFEGPFDFEITSVDCIMRDPCKAVTELLAIKKVKCKTFA